MPSTSNFIDVATIWLHAAKTAMARSASTAKKFVISPGPDGGDGGRGGNIVFQADPNLSTLMDFRYKRKLCTAPNGENGAVPARRQDAVISLIRVPGTVLKEAETGLVVADLPAMPRLLWPRAAAAVGVMPALPPPPVRSRALPSPVCPGEDIPDSRN